MRTGKDRKGGHVGQQLCSCVSVNGGIKSENVIPEVDGKIVVNVVNDLVESPHKEADHEEHDEKKNKTAMLQDNVNLSNIFFP